MRKLNLSIVDGKWYDFEGDQDIKFMIGPFPYTNSLFDLTSDTVDIKSNKLSQMRLLFMECLVDWKGFSDENDQPLECNNRNKSIVFDNMTDIVLSVVDKATSSNNDLSIELKNL